MFIGCFAAGIGLRVFRYLNVVAPGTVLMGRHASFNRHSVWYPIRRLTMPSQNSGIRKSIPPRKSKIAEDYARKERMEPPKATRQEAPLVAAKTKPAVSSKAKKR
jgi:hypothetical protein